MAVRERRVDDVKRRAVSVAPFASARVRTRSPVARTREATLTLRLRLTKVRRVVRLAVVPHFRLGRTRRELRHWCRKVASVVCKLSLCLGVRIERVLVFVRLLVLGRGRLCERVSGRCRIGRSLCHGPCSVSRARVIDAGEGELGRSKVFHFEPAPERSLTSSGFRHATNFSGLPEFGPRLTSQLKL